MQAGVQWEVKRCMRDVAGTQSWVGKTVGEFLKSLLGLQDVIKNLAVHPLHNFHLSCFMIL